ncbi:hypothetical protein BH11PSE10_BH11PSE10_11920 [soil metagenome]
MGAPGLHERPSDSSIADELAADRAHLEAELFEVVPDELEFPGDSEILAADSNFRAGPQADEAALALLVQRIVRQDEAALASLYRNMSRRVFAQALRITRDIGCAEEVVEDVFWQVWRQAPRFDPARGSAIAWVSRMARSRALDAMRAKGRNPLWMAVDLDSDKVQEQGSQQDDPLRRISEAQSAAMIDQALIALDPLRRQLVALAFQGGYSQAEIAEQTGLPLGTVKSHIRRALAQMKTIIQAAGGASLFPANEA